jgi:hypothetical protein
LSTIHSLILRRCPFSVSRSSSIRPLQLAGGNGFPHALDEETFLEGITRRVIRVRARITPCRLAAGECRSFLMMTEERGATFCVDEK